MSVRFCLSYDLLDAILSPSQFLYFNENLHCRHGRRYDATFFRQKCYVKCGHKVIYYQTDYTKLLCHESFAQAIIDWD